MIPYSAPLWRTLNGKVQPSWQPGILAKDEGLRASRSFVLRASAPSDLARRVKNGVMQVHLAHVCWM